MVWCLLYIKKKAAFSLLKLFVAVVFLIANELISSSICVQVINKVYSKIPNMGDFVRIYPHDISLKQRWPWCLLCTFLKLKRVHTWNFLQLYDAVVCNSYTSRLASLARSQTLSRGSTLNSVLRQPSQSHRCQVSPRARPGSLRSMPLVCSQATSTFPAPGRYGDNSPRIEKPSKNSHWA